MSRLSVADALNTRAQTALYVMWRADGVALYVGQSDNPRVRIRAHRTKRWWPEVDTVSVFDLGRLDWQRRREQTFRRLAVEAQMIEDLRPLCNQRGRDGGKVDIPEFCRVARDVMRERRISQWDLGARVGISQSQLCARLLGHLPWRGDEQQRVADALGIEAVSA